MNLCGKLGLGTVQWGMAYGIANRDGRRPQPTEVGRMLRQAQAAGVDLLDTAAVYGEAESVIGQHAELTRHMKVVTKTAPWPQYAADQNVAAVLEEAFVQSLKRLKCHRVYGLLVHQSADLLSPHGARIWCALEDFKARGLVTRIGVSVYDPDELERVIAILPIEIVQLPFNLYDQRFLQSGWLKQLHRAGVEVHGRSAFLQGLLLIAAEQLPQAFNQWRSHHQRLYREFEAIGASPLTASLRFCLDQPDIDRVIVGCESPQQLDEILGAASADNVTMPHASTFAVDDGAMIDPRRWTR